MYNPYLNEDAAWKRLAETQREMENSRILATDIATTLTWMVNLAIRAWILSGLAMRRAPRRRPALGARSEVR